ncbi:hypothetical protein L218DRAFT_324996 [Marasmius fiardii PR-910]|nr:hypothetical protein L218DRAFT_324996 [Marasmius fiardii PR-910]
MNHVVNNHSASSQSTTLHSPTPQSLAFRTKLTGLVSPLKRIRPTVPFWRLPAHRIPTLHLYRSLLRVAPTDNIHWRVRNIFRHNQHLTGIEATTRGLRSGYRWLEIFKSAASCDKKSQSVVKRYDRMIGSKIEKEHWKDLIGKELEEQRRARNRPMLTGSIMRATIFHPAMPRMRPQPEEISPMIRKRILQKIRRLDKLSTWSEYRDMSIREREFEEGLFGNNVEDREAVWGGRTYKDWIIPLSNSSGKIYKALTRQTERSREPVPPELLERVKEVRRRKIEYRTRQREEERRGEVTESVLRRRRKGLPGHVRGRMTKEQIKQELIIQRSVAEVGYVGQLKVNKGFKLRTPKGEGNSEGKTWSVIDGTWTSKEEEDALRERVEAIMEENERRQVRTSTDETT